jgi:hypothetical protein
MTKTIMNRFFGIYAKSNSKYWQSVTIHLNEEFRNLVREAIRDRDEIYIPYISEVIVDRLIDKLFLRIVAIFEEQNLPSDTSFKVKLTVKINRRYKSISKTQVVSTHNRDSLNTLFIRVLTWYIENNPDIAIDKVLINYHV